MNWLSVNQAAVHSEQYLQQIKGVVGKGYSTWHIRKLAHKAYDDPQNAKFEVRLSVSGDRWEIEQTSFERFLREEAQPHGAHTEHTRTINGKEIRIRPRK